MRRVLVCAVWAAAFAAITPAQTLVEHAVITSGSALGAAGMRGAGQAAAKVFDNAVKALGQSGAAGHASAGTAAAAQVGTETSVITLPRSDDKQLKPNTTVPDPKSIQIGMTADQLTSKFGPPVMKVNGANSETWFYGATPNELLIELKAGQVSSVTPPKGQAAVQQAAKSEPKRDTGIVVIQ